MRRNLLSRLERLEKQVRLEMQSRIRIGVLKPLPDDFVGERHIVVVKQLPSTLGPEIWEYEERPGRGRPLRPEDVPTLYISEDDMNL
jgi:hypothetical protein